MRELKLANGIDDTASVGAFCLHHGIPHGGPEGTEERVLTLRELKLVQTDRRVGVCRGPPCGMVSLMVEQKAPRSVS